MKYKVLITTSGTGSRLGDLTKYTNKCLVRIGKKPAISYIIEKYSKNVPIVVTLGYFGNQVRDFLELAYPDRKFEFVTVDKYEGLGTSLGYSMLCAEKNLRCPFIFHASDTITEGKIPAPSTNWMAGYKGGDASQYASWKIIDKNHLVFNEKGSADFDYLHMGLVGIKEYSLFWRELRRLYKNNPNDPSLNDCQTINTMLRLGSKFNMVEFNDWLDTGNIAALNNARQKIADKFDNLDKIDESIYLFGDFVIKFFYDKEILKNRMKRAKVLKGLIPKIDGIRDNFYRYKHVRGDTFSSVVTNNDFESFLQWAKKKLWISKRDRSEKEFKKVCSDFYLDKTLKRINTFFSLNSIKDSSDNINGSIIPPVFELLQNIDRDWLSSGNQSSFHGDCILENIIKSKNGFSLIDWRQDFGGLIDSGDMYYDLAKLNHNLTVNHGLVNRNLFTIEIDDNRNIRCSILTDSILQECKGKLSEFIHNNNLDLDKVETITAIIWLNMSPLHHYPFNVFLYYFGKYSLWKMLNKMNKKNKPVNKI